MNSTKAPVVFIDAGWPAVAEACLEWLDKQGL